MNFNFGNSLGTTSQQQQQQQPVSFGVGTLGSGFPTASTSTSAPGGFFGGGLGTSTQTGTAPTFGGGSLFGNTSQPSATGTTFGAPITSTNTGFGSFGQPQTLNPFQTTSNAAPAFGHAQTGLVTVTSQPATGGLFGFSTNQPSTTGFNTGGLIGTQPLATSTAFSGFGTTTGSCLFGVGNKPATGSVFTFNQPIGQKPGGLLGQPQQQQQTVQSEVDPNTFLPKLFNDERDRIVGEFNKLQAHWGHGKGYFAPNVPPVEFNQHQSLHKFKAIGFSEIKTPSKEEPDKIDVLVKCDSNEQLIAAIPQYEANLKNLFGMHSNVKVENSKLLPDQKAFLSISVVDINTNKRLPTFQLVAYYEQPHIRQQFCNAFCNNFIELIRPLSKQEIDQYLKVPPSGIDLLLWDQAKKENPDPEKFIPVAFVGFEALNSRFKFQVQETEQQKARLQLIAEDINSLQRDVSAMRAKVDECKRRNVNLSNRLLKIMVWQEIRRKGAYAVMAEEDELRQKIRVIQDELNAPTKYKGCLNELICKLRHMQSQRHVVPKFNLEEGLMKELETHLSKEQQGIEHLLELVKKDLQDLKSIKGTLVSI